MMPDTQHIIVKFWAVAEKHVGISHKNKICQCATENIIRDSENPPLARAFLLASVAIDQAMRHNPFCDYEAFARQFTFPRLEQHGGWGDEASADWVVYSFYEWDKKMDWPLGASVFCQLADDLRRWLSKSTWGEAAFRHFSVRSGWLVPLFAKYSKEASVSVLSSLEQGEAQQSIWNMVEVRKRPDLVMQLLNLVDPGSQEWDSLVSTGIEIASDQRDSLLGFELLTKAVSPNTQRAHKLLGILLQIVTERKDTELAIRVVKFLKPSHFMRTPFIELIASILRSGRDGSLALQLWEVTSDGDSYHGESLRIALEAATNSYNPDLLYGVARAVGTQHPSYPNLIGRFLESFRKTPSQSTLEKMLKTIGEEHPAFDSVLEVAHEHMLRLSREHQCRRKAAAARTRQRMHQQRLLSQKARSKQRRDHLESMAKWRPVDRLAYLARECGHPLAYYPAEWANIEDGDLAFLDDETRKTLADRLRTIRKGPWRKLMARLHSTGT